MTSENSLKWWKCFLFHLKSSCRSWNFCSEFLVIHAEKRLDKKAQVNFKIYDTTNLITNNFSTHITRYHKIFRYEIRSVNRTEHEKYCFSEKTCTNCGEETGPRLFLKKSKLSILSLDQQPEVSYRLFLLYVKVEGYQNMLKLRC